MSKNAFQKRFFIHVWQNVCQLLHKTFLKYLRGDFMLCVFFLKKYYFPLRHRHGEDSIFHVLYQFQLLYWIAIVLDKWFLWLIVSNTKNKKFYRNDRMFFNPLSTTIGSIWHHLDILQFYFTFKICMLNYFLGIIL